MTRLLERKFMLANSRIRRSIAALGSGSSLMDRMFVRRCSILPVRSHHLIYWVVGKTCKPRPGANVRLPRQAKVERAHRCGGCFVRLAGGLELPTECSRASGVASGPRTATCKASRYPAVRPEAGIVQAVELMRLNAHDDVPQTVSDCVAEHSVDAGRWRTAR